MQNFVSLIFVGPLIPVVSLGDCCINECGSNDCDMCDFGYPAFIVSLLDSAQLILKNLMRLTIDKQMKIQYMIT